MRIFKCNYCNNLENVNIWKMIYCPHLFNKFIYSKCKYCNKRSWLKRVNSL